MKTPFSQIRAIAETPWWYNTAKLGQTPPRFLAAAAKPAAPEAQTSVRKLCVAAGVDVPASGRIPVAALDHAMKTVGWSIEKRMAFKDEFAGLIET